MYFIVSHCDLSGTNDDYKEKEWSRAKDRPTTHLSQGKYKVNTCDKFETAVVHSVDGAFVEFSRDVRSVPPRRVWRGAPSHLERRWDVFTLYTHVHITDGGQRSER